MYKVVLNPTEQRLARHLARSRYETSRGDGIPDRKVGPQSCFETDLEGVAAEIALARLLNVYPDTEINRKAHHDLTVALHGRTAKVDVKATKYGSGRLLVARHKVDYPAQAYALMVGTFPSYRLAGFAPAATVFREANLTDLGHGPSYNLTQSQLVPLDVLMDILYGSMS